MDLEHLYYVPPGLDLIWYHPTVCAPAQHHGLIIKDVPSDTHMLQIFECY